MDGETKKQIEGHTDAIAKVVANHGGTLASLEVSDAHQVFSIHWVSGKLIVRVNMGGQTRMVHKQLKDALNAYLSTNNIPLQARVVQVCSELRFGE